MSRALYLVIHSQGNWWVDFEGKAHGPFPSRETAALEAKHLAQFSAHSGRASEVLVPDTYGRHRVVWASSQEFPPQAPHKAAE